MDPRVKKGVLVIVVLVVSLCISALYYHSIEARKDENKTDGNVSLAKPTEIPICIKPQELNETEENTSGNVSVAIPAATPTPEQTPAELNETMPCETGESTILPGDTLDALSRKTIADYFSFFKEKDKAASAIMRARIEGYVRDKEISSMDGKFEQLVYSRDGKIHNICDIYISFPEQSLPFRAYLLTTENPKTGDKVKIVFFYDNDIIVMAGWSKALDVTLITGSDSGGDGGSSEGSDGGSEGGPVGDVPA